MLLDTTGIFPLSLYIDASLYCFTPFNIYKQLLPIYRCIQKCIKLISFFQRKERYSIHNKAKPNRKMSSSNIVCAYCKESGHFMRSKSGCITCPSLKKKEERKKANANREVFVPKPPAEAPKPPSPNQTGRRMSRFELLTDSEDEEESRLTRTIEFPKLPLLPFESSQVTEPTTGAVLHRSPEERKKALHEYMNYLSSFNTPVTIDIGKPDTRPKKCWADYSSDEEEEEEE